MSRKKTRIQPAKQDVTSNNKNAKSLAIPAGLNSMMLWLIMLVVLLPALYSSTAMDPVIAVRYIFLSGVLLLFVAYFFVYRKSVSGFPFPRPVIIVFVAGLLYAIWMMVSMTTAINYREGYYEIGRHLLNLLFLFVVVITVITEETSLIKIFKVLVIVAIFQSLVGIMQYYNIGFTQLPGANDKPYGLMANRNVFGSALMLLFPFVIYVLYRCNKIWKIVALVAIGFLVCALLLSQTRSAWIATAVICVVSLLLVLMFSKTQRRPLLIGSVAIVAGSVLLIFLTLISDSKGELKQSVIERANSFTRGGVTNDKNKDNAQQRFQIWQKTTQLIKDHPIMGCGPGNWRIAILAYGTEGTPWAYGKYSPDRAHNVYLQTMAESGLPGGILYFGMWLLIAIVAFKIILRPKNEEQRVLIILMLSGLAGLAVDASFSFPTERIEHSIFILIMAGIILGSYAANNLQNKKIPIPIFLPIALIMVCLLNLYLGFAKYNFEGQWNRAKKYEKAGLYQQMLNEAEKGKSSFITLEPVGSPMEFKTALAFQGLKQYDNALLEIDKAIKYNPNLSNVWNTRGTIHTEQGQFDSAIADYLVAKKLTPHYEIALKNLAMNYYNIKKYKECVATLNELDVSQDAYLLSVKNYAKMMMGNR